MFSNITGLALKPVLGTVAKAVCRTATPTHTPWG
jgi:hypothetical protein